MSLSHYYGKAKAGMIGINPKEATELGEKLLIAGGTGAGLGLISAGLGGLDHKVFGFNVPVDGLASLVLGGVGLAIQSPELCTASVAAAGSAATRSFEALFKKGLGAHGDSDFDYVGSQMGFGAAPNPAMDQTNQFAGQFGGQFGFGADGKDRLIEAAKALDAAA